MSINHTKHQIAGLDCILARHSDAKQKPNLIAVICHGFGAPGTDLVPIADEMLDDEPDLHDCLFVFPAAPISLDQFYESRAWWHIDMEALQRCMEKGEFREMRDSVPDGLAECNQKITQIVNHLIAEHQLSASKIVVGGFSQGAMLTTDVALNFAENLGGLIIWSGSLLNHKNWKATAEKQQPLDIAQSHGRLDPILPFFAAEDLRDMLTACNHRIEFAAFHGQHAIPPVAVQTARNLLKRVAAG